MAIRFENVRLQVGAFTLTADLEIASGARVAVMGPSGAGKSTLLAGLCGFLPLAAGRIVIAGQDITNAAPGARPVATLFQDGNLFPHLTAVQNLGLGLRPDLRLSREEACAVQTALDRVGLAGLGGRKPAQLSGGQQSRVALARVLLQRRAVLALDEPFAALGPALKAEMLDLVGEVAQETKATVLMVTHDPADARRLTDETVLVAEGRAHPPAPTGTLLDDPPAALREYLGA